MSLLVKGISLQDVKDNVKLNELQDPDGAVALATQILDNIGAPADTGDGLRKGTRITVAELLDAAVGEFLEGGGVGSNPVFNALIASNIPNLAASKITSGRFGLTRLEWGNAKLLEGAGAGSAPTEIDVPAAATKEFFVLPSQYYVNADAYWEGFYYHTGIRLNANSEKIYLEFYIPEDFSSVTAAVLVVNPFATSTQRFTYRSSYAAHGEQNNIHTELSSDQDFGLTSDEIDELDVSGILSSLVAGDYVGLEIITSNTNTANLLILGLRFKYS